MKKILSQAISEITSKGTTFCIVLLLFAVLTIPVLVLNAYAQGPPPGVQSSQLGSLADRWTKWIISLDTNTEPNPFETVYQGDCSQLLQGNTMFLVGQRGGMNDLEDHGTCSISSGTTIFFPVVNYIVADCTSKQQQSPQLPSLCSSDIRIPAEGQPFADLRELANSNIDGVDNLEATLDDQPLEFARAESPPGGFGVRVSPNNALFGDLTSLFQRPISLHAVVDGYWGLVTSLSPGEHTLTFGGCFHIDGTTDCQTNTYELVVRR